MDYINITPENIVQEHICCCLASKTTEQGIAAKKAWLSDRMRDGLKFTKLNSRGKVFIEYQPAENGWMPINAEGYMLINCHWVSGSYKGHGYGKQLLEKCEKDSKSMNGVVVVVGSKKKPFLSDKAFYEKYGYEVCDSASPYFELMVKRFNKNAALPCFNTCAKEGMPKDIKGIDIFYTAQCPFTVPYVEMLKPVIGQAEIPIRTYQITTKEEAQSHFCPITNYSVFVNGKFYTNVILTPAKLEELAKNIFNKTN